jgi:hypothetical protein
LFTFINLENSATQHIENSLKFLDLNSSASVIAKNVYDVVQKKLSLLLCLPGSPKLLLYRILDSSYLGFLSRGNKIIQARFNAGDVGVDIGSEGAMVLSFQN